MGNISVYSILFCLFTIIGSSLKALPSNPTVISGNATFDSNGKTYAIDTSTNRTIIEWNNFSSNLNEVIQINQPNETSAILNRVVSINSSSLLGDLNSNGGVYLINPNGIIMGEGSVINTALFLASTLDVANSEFLSGLDMTFQGSSTEAVRNYGDIIAFSEDVYLIGHEVENAGNVFAPSGVLGIGIGKEIIIKPLDQDRIFIVPQASSPSGTGYTQTGDISAREIILKADGNLYSLAMNVTGTIEAIGTQTENGRVLLISEEGKVQLSDSASVSYHGTHGDGGEICITGKKVELLDQTDISTCNECGGGLLLIGGSMGGTDPTILNADYTTVGEDVCLDASSRTLGNAGDISVFANKTATFAGTAYAVGGVAGGNGGTIEVSGKEDLIFSGSVDTMALNGETGLLIIDPNNITISNGTTNLTNGCPSFSGGSGTNILKILDLQNCLNSSNVLVTTTPGTDGSGDIGTGAVITLTSPGNNLTLNADRDINVTRNITFTDSVGSAALTFKAGRDFAITSGDILKCNDAASLNISSGNSVAGGSIKVNGTITTTDTLSVNFNAITSTSDINIETTGFGVSANGSTVTTTTSLTAGQDVSIRDNMINPGTGNITLNVGRDLLVGNSTSASRLGARDGDISATIGRDLNVTGGIGGNDSAQIGFDSPLDVTSNLTFNVGRNVNITAPSGSSRKFAMIGHGNRVTVGGNKSGDITFNSIGGNVTLQSTGGTDSFVQIGHRRGGSGSVTITGDIKGSGPNGVVDVPGNLIIQGGAGAGAYALFGHGGGSDNQNDSFTGTIGVRANNISINGGTTASANAAFAGIGFSARNFNGTLTVNSPSSVRVISQNNVTLQADRSYVFLGARFRTSGVATASATLPTISIQTGLDLNLLGHFPHNSADEVVCGAYVNSGDAQSNLDVNVGRNLFVSTGSGGATTSGVMTLITNGISAVDGYTETITVGNNASLLGGNNLANIQAIDILNMNVIGNLTLTASTDGPASILAEDSTTVTAGKLLTITGNSAPEQAIIQNTAGTLSVTGDQIIVQNPNGLIENLGIGNSTITTTSSDLDVLEAGTISVGGILSVNSGKDINVSAAGSSPSTIMSTGTSIFTAAQNISLLGPQQASIITTTGDMSINAPSGTLTINSGTFIENMGLLSGFLSASGNRILIQDGGFLENLGIGTTTVTTLNDLDILEGGFIRTGGILTGNMGRDLNLTAVTTGVSYIRSASSGTIRASRNITLTGPQTVYIENLAGNLLVIANNNITVNPFTSIRNQGAGDLTLVVDNQAPSSPGFGTGRFVIAANGEVGRVGGGLLRIFTAIRSHNSVSGTFNINGNTFVPGPFLVDSPTEIYATYFPSSLGGTPYTFFYKEPFPPPPLPSPPSLPAANFELFYLLNPYYPYLAWQWKYCIFRSLQQYEEIEKKQSFFDLDFKRECYPHQGEKYL